MWPLAAVTSSSKTSLRTTSFRNAAHDNIQAPMMIVEEAITRHQEGCHLGRLTNYGQLGPGTDASSAKTRASVVEVQHQGYWTRPWHLKAKTGAEAI
jgi:hypothetical protein